MVLVETRRKARVSRRGNMQQTSRTKTRSRARTARAGAPLGSALACALSIGLLHCGGESSLPVSDAAAGLSVEQRTSERLDGRFIGASAGSPVLEFASTRSAPLSGDVEVVAGSLAYTLHYDYGGAREVIADGQGDALERPTQGLVLEALDAVKVTLGRDEPALPLHEQMLFAALTLLAESGGMPLTRLRFPLATDEVEKSLGNDGVTCIERGSAYEVSFDDADATVEGETVTADSEDCNGLCGPGCEQLTPWKMWTLDCLEHDRCCAVSGQLDAICWTPLGECGDEYAAAEGDFLRGFDPLQRHCGG
jgi:hypothetical protein